MYFDRSAETTTTSGRSWPSSTRADAKGASTIGAPERGRVAVTAPPEVRTASVNLRSFSADQVFQLDRRTSTSSWARKSSVRAAPRPGLSGALRRPLTKSKGESSTWR